MHSIFFCKITLDVVIQKVNYLKIQKKNYQKLYLVTTHPKLCKRIIFKSEIMTHVK